MKNKILLSIIIPVYNVEEYIEECLNSILAQKNMNDVEIICIDDGSTDNSGNICDKYEKKDKRFKVFHKKNEGIAVTRNFGLSKSKGEYIAWIDSDDYITSNWYSSIEPLLKERIDIIFFDYIVSSNKKIKKIKYYSESKYIDKKFFLQELVLDEKMKSQLWHKIFKRKLMKNIVFPDLEVMEDYAVLPDIILKSDTIYYLSKELYVYKIRKNSLTTETNFEKTYIYYINAKKRYEYLMNKKIYISKLGYLKYALSTYIQFLKLKEEYNNISKRNKFVECKLELDRNKKNILYIKCNKMLKIKFILYYFNLLKVVLYFYK